MEIVAMMTLIAGAIIIRFFTSNNIIIAYVTALAESIGYYSYAIIREFIAQRRNHSGNILSNLRKSLRNVFLEFGPAEMMDSFITRPAAMYIFPLITGNVTVGIIVGKLAADVVFYIPTIISREVMKRYMHR